MREWEHAYNKWLSDGMPEESDPKHIHSPKPGPHPEPNHTWNKDPQQHIRVASNMDHEMKLRTDFEYHNEAVKDIEEY